MVNNNVIKTLKKFIDKYGLPKEIGVIGWIAESQIYTYKNVYIGTATEESKGWMYINHYNEDLKYYNYCDANTVFHIARAIIANQTSNTELLVEIDEKEFILDLINDDYEGKGWNWDPDVEDTEYVARENNLIDKDEEFDLYDFLDKHCEIIESEIEYSLPYHVAFIKWSNKRYLQLGSKGNKIVLKETVDEQEPILHQIIVELGDKERTDNINKWLETNIKSKYFFTFKPSSYGHTLISFENEEDATVFSLRWM